MELSFRQTVSACAKLAMGCALWLTWSPAHPAEGGASNYLAGFYGDLLLAVAPPDGWSMRSDLYYYAADGAGSVRSGQVELEVDAVVTFEFLTALYKPGKEFLGGQLAFGLSLPVGYLDLASRLRVGDFSLGIGDTGLGFGDLTAISTIYWNRGKYNFSWGNYVVAPTGRYDVDRIANTGLNYWTVESDFMMTYFDPDKGQDYSVVAGYSYNFENHDTDYQSGDELHLDFVLNQFLSESLAVGLSGFWYKQIGGDSGAGAVLGDFKGEAMGLGPNLYYIKNLGGRDVAFTLKWIKEFNVENRLEGDHVFASFALSF